MDIRVQSYVPVQRASGTARIGSATPVAAPVTPVVPVTRGQPEASTGSTAQAQPSTSRMAPAYYPEDQRGRLLDVYV